MSETTAIWKFVIFRNLERWSVLVFRSNMCRYVCVYVVRSVSD